MIPGNGGEKVDPNEMSLEEKKKAFEANPDDFIHIKDLIVATAKTPKGVAVLINPASPHDYHYSRSVIDYTLQQQLAFIDIQRAKAAQENQKIITNVHNKMNFKNFLRKGN